MTEQVKIKLMSGGHMPEKKSAGAAAWDCYARIHEKHIPTDQLVIAGIWVSRFPWDLPWSFPRAIMRKSFPEVPWESRRGCEFPTVQKLLILIIAGKFV